MGWLGKLFGSASIKPSYGSAAEDIESPDWQTIEDLLVRLCEAEIRRFAGMHPHESFYGFGFDCSSEQGQVLLCLSSRAGLIDMARQFMASRMYAGMTETEIAVSNEWGFGGWKYQGFNLDSEDWQESWAGVELQISNAMNILATGRKFDTMFELRSSFMEMACRALLRLEKSEAMGSLKRDADFRVLCTDHDEGPDDGFARLARISAG